MIRPIAVISAGLLALNSGSPARAQSPQPLKDPIPHPIPVSPIQVQLTPLVTGLTAPIFLTPAANKGGSRADYVLDQAGLVLILRNGQIDPTPALDITATIAQLSPAFPGAPNGLNPGYDERGLLGLALHPRFHEGDGPGARTLYTLHNVPVTRAADFPEPPFPDASVVPNCQEVIAEWKVERNGLRIDPTSYREVLRFDRPEFNHNGGTVAFGPDGLLYAAFGDGGNANDVGPGHNPVTGNAQDLTTILGKMIRIDPLDPRTSRDGDAVVSANGKYRIPRDNPFVRRRGAVREIFAYGFRNPFRFSFQHDGQLVLADVGQNNIEEVDIVVRGGNYGWHLKEGTFPFDPTTGNVFAPTGRTPGLIDPVVEYDHFEATPGAPQRLAVIGGFVYRGRLNHELRGKYICADLAGVLLVADLDRRALAQLIPNAGMFIKGIGQDSDGELYVLGSELEGPSGKVGVIAQIRQVGGGRGRD